VLFSALKFVLRRRVGTRSAMMTNLGACWARAYGYFMAKPMASRALDEGPWWDCSL
jgi:hypothetical protein